MGITLFSRPLPAIVWLTRLANCLNFELERLFSKSIFELFLLLLSFSSSSIADCFSYSWTSFIAVNDIFVLRFSHLLVRLKFSKLRRLCKEALIRLRIFLPGYTCTRLIPRQNRVGFFWFFFQWFVFGFLYGFLQVNLGHNFCLTGYVVLYNRWSSNEHVWQNLKKVFLLRVELSTFDQQKPRNSEHRPVTGPLTPWTTPFTRCCYLHLQMTLRRNLLLVRFSVNRNTLFHNKLLSTNDSKI